VTLGQLRRLMSRAPRLSHLGTGAFRPADGGEEGVDFGHMVTAFAESGRGRTLLSLSGFRDLAQEYLPTIAVVCANLRTLDLSYAPVTPNQIVMFIGQCFNLETLWVPPCFPILVLPLPCAYVSLLMTNSFLGARLCA
jgi:hypothetical protein